MIGRRWMLPVGWAALILALTSVPGSAVPDVGVDSADKLVHLGMYAVLAWLAVRATSPTPAGVAVATFMAVAAFAALDEWHQQFIPGRTTDAADLVADIVGGGAGILAFQAAQRRRESAS